MVLILRAGFGWNSIWDTLGVGRLTAEAFSGPAAEKFATVCVDASDWLKPGRKCPECGKPHKEGETNINRRFCSDACKFAHYRRPEIKGAKAAR